MSRRESVGRLRAASQSESAQPTVKMVSCAVLPPRLPAAMAPPTNIGASGAISYDEALNWQHNEPIQEEEPSRRKSIFRKVGITTQRKRAASNGAEDDELPPFVMRQIPYDTWRKHYAKDKDGNYRGTHAPAEDCLLKPEDVQKWRLGDPVTKADKWTRGKEALPVYSEVRDEGALPEYQTDYHDSYQPSSRALDEPEYIDVTQQTQSDPQQQQQQVPSLAQPRHPSAAPGWSRSVVPPCRAETIADGKTAAEIIGEAQAKGKPKLTWRQKLSKGAQMTMGSSMAVTGT